MRGVRVTLRLQPGDSREFYRFCKFLHGYPGHELCETTPGNSDSSADGRNLRVNGVAWASANGDGMRGCPSRPGTPEKRGSGECLRLNRLGCDFHRAGISRQVEPAHDAFRLAPEVFGRDQALPQRVGAAGDGGASDGPFRGELRVQRCAPVRGFFGDLATGVCRAGGRPSARLFRKTGYRSALAAAGLCAAAGICPMLVCHVRQNDSSTAWTPFQGFMWQLLPSRSTGSTNSPSSAAARETLPGPPDPGAAARCNACATPDHAGLAGPAAAPSALAGMGRPHAPNPAP